MSQVKIFKGSPLPSFSSVLKEDTDLVKLEITLFELT
jgi:hypothetical protein